MKALIREVHQLLITRNISIAAAESCTGGLLSYHLTSISGSSGYFKLALIAYSNEAKENLLRIKKSLIKDKGAVSAEVALKMSQAIRAIAKTDLGISITGISGPTGGNKRKPVGLVYIAISSKNKSKVKKLNFSGSRKEIRGLAATNALKLLKRWLA